MKSTILSFAIVVATVFGGCSHTTSPSGQAGDGRPGVGSWFVFSHSSIDPYTFEEAAWPPDLIDSITAKGITTAGKNNVTVIQEEYDTSQNRYKGNLALSYDSSGHLFWLPAVGGWQEVPSVGTKVYSFADTSHLKSSTFIDSLSSLGPEDLTLAGHTFHTTKIGMTHHFWVDGIESESSGTTEYYWFSSEVGTYVQYYQAPYKQVLGERKVLKSYTLKY